MVVNKSESVIQLKYAMMKNLTKTTKFSWRFLMLALVGVLYLSAFTATQWKKEGNDKKMIGSEEWADYKNWYKVTKEPNTGDPTGFLDKEHRGVKAYRDVFINSIGEATNKGEAEFPYPEGTIIVLEAFKDKGSWEEQKKPELTIMIKLSIATSPETGDWEFVDGASGKNRGSGTSKLGVFCGSCHINAMATDYNFMNYTTIGK